MKFIDDYFCRFRGFSALIVALFMLGSGGQLQAQMKWLAIGSFQSPYSELAAVIEGKPFGNAPAWWPGIERSAGNTRAGVMWIAATNFTDESGTTFPVKVAHIGPRGVQIQFFPKTLEVISQVDPEITVDGQKSFFRFVFIDEFDETMKADRMVHNVSTTAVGVDVEQKIYAFSQEYHDNYHIVEYKFTNTGTISRPDQTHELTKTLEGVYFFFISRYSVNNTSTSVRGGGAPWGKFTMNDAVGDGHEDYGVDFRAQYAWAGFNPDRTDFNTLGGPMMFATPTKSAVDDSTGRLAGAHMVGRVTIHADKSVADRSDDPEQPRTMGTMGSDDPDLVELEFDVELMERQYEWMSGVKSAGFSLTDPLGGAPNGRLWPHQADWVEPDDDGVSYTGQNFVTPSNNPALFAPQGRFDEGGWAIIEGYGPYTLAPGEFINIVVAEGVNGLSDSAKLEIGKLYKQSGADDGADITWMGDSMTKNEWVMTTKDSLFQTFERAIANWKSGFNIPQPPLPPATFMVTSGSGEISLSWTMYGRGPTVTGFELWRVAKRFDDPTGYIRIATLGATANSYSDTDIIRGIDYYYYLQAVGAVNSDTTGLTPTGTALNSGRYYTQTYLPANLKRAAGEELKDIVIVPNPFSLSADQDIRWPDRQDKLAFLNIPKFCDISIYTQLGELVAKIEHRDGSGDEFWDHTTTSRQVIASGVYIALIEETDAAGKSTGNDRILKFSIIR
ncbi:MAG: hypothetical protein IID14_01370 [Candidatus Marinimicrobia bacterium]|nr:hypothetical protein [Candidatus Neomarinimicrobiota bacterium]